MDQPLVNIIIPVYKTEKYLHRCLKSVQNQTYKNIEVILVDDGSPDNCPQICDEYAAEDSRFHVIHKENGGVSSARNAGLDYCAKSAGGYIGFVDSDDWLPLNSIEVLIKDNQLCDFIIGNHAVVLVSGAKKSAVWSDGYFDRKKREDFLKLLGPASSPWGKLYSKSLIKKTGLRFCNDMKMCEDCVFVFTFLNSCESIKACSENVYYYSHLNKASLAGSFYHEQNKWLLRVCSSKLQLYSGAIPKYMQSQICELFYAALKHYIYFLSRDDAMDKIKETCMLFLPTFKFISLDQIKEYDNFFARWFVENYIFADCKMKLQ